MKKSNFANRFLAFSIAMTMIFGMSFSVFADETETLNTKIANAENGSVITLDKDYTEDVVVSSGKSVTIDLAGHTLKGTDTASTATIKVEKGATLVVKGDGKIINNSTGNGAACIFNNGTVTIENGTIKKETGNKSYYNIANHGKMIINGGTILNDTPYEEGKSHASLVENGYYDYTSTNPVLGYVEGENEANPSLEINGGTFDGGLNTIKNDDGAKLIINDAKVKNQIQVAVFNVSEAEIKGGTFDVPAGNDKTTVFNRKYNDTVNKGKITVLGGEFNADYFIEVINNATEAQMGEIKILGGIFNTKKGLVNTEGRVDISTIEISGGTFAVEPSGDKLASNVEKFEKANGEWVVGKKVVLTLKFENASGDKVENLLSGEEVTLPTAEKEGFEFKGWKKDDEITYKAGDKVKVEENLTLTAQWEEEKKEEESGETGKEPSGDVSGETGKEPSGDISGETGKEPSGDVSGETGKEPSGDVSGETGREPSGDEAKDTSGEKEDSGDKKDEDGKGNNSGKNNDDKKDNEKDDKETKEPITYDDVKEDDWFKTYVDKASEMELVNGVGNNKFAPNDNVSRGMLVTILYRYSGVEEESVTTFEDVSLDAYYAKAISWAQKNNIVNGVGNNKFEPDREITREELATIIYRFVKLQKEELEEVSETVLEYVDKNEIAEFAIEPIAWCTKNGIINGRENKMMAPKEKSTRAEATTMIVRLAELLNQ